MLKFILSSLLIVKTMAADTVNIVVSGDSLSAGVFAGSEGIKTKDVDYKEREGSIFRKAILFLVENHGSSWATGDVDYSIVSRIERLGFSVNAFNSSVSGATSGDVVRTQIEASFKWMQEKGINNLGMFMFFVGANNLCQKEHQDVNSFRADYEMVANIIPANAKIFVPLPNISKLYKLKNERSKLLAKCSSIWKLTNSCPTVMHGDNIEDIIKQYNNAIKDIAESVNGIYVNDVDMYEFDKSEVSGVDCFHASSNGQEHLSNMVWRSILNARK